MSNKDHFGVVFIIFIFIIILVKSCDAYCEKNNERWKEEDKQYWEQVVHDSYHACKFEHD